MFGDRAYCALTRRFRPNDAAILQAIASMAAQAGVPTVVTGDVLYHTRERRRLQDVVTCIRLKTTIDKAGFLKEKHADRFLKTPAEMKRLFRRFPEALARTQEIAARCSFSLDELTYSYPTEALDAAVGTGAAGESSPGKAPRSAMRMAYRTTSPCSCGMS